MKMIMMMTMIVIDENHLGWNQRTHAGKHKYKHKY